MEADTFEVVFLDDDKKTILDKQNVESGKSVKYKGNLPVKEPTAYETYTFSGWINEEKLDQVNENLVLIAKYTVETKNSTKDAMFEASLQNAEGAVLNETIDAGKKVDMQQKAIAKDPRTVSEIVSEVMKNGKAEIGQDINKDNVEK